jgi:GAF domain-containing protein
VIARAGDVLAASLDYEETLRALGRVVIPDLADWYAVHLVDEETGAIRQVHVDHLDPSKVELAWELWRTYPPPDPDAPDGIPAVIRTGRPELIAEVTDEMVTTALEPLFPELIPVFRKLRLRSVMIVPLRGADRVFGALQLVAAESGRSYASEDLEVAEEIAARAAGAIDNALLYRERERVSMALQQRLLPKALPRRR